MLKYCGSVVLLMTGALACRATTVVLAARPAENNQLRRQVELASRFYGLDVREVSSGAAVIEAAKKPDTIAFIVDGAVLPEIRRDETLVAFGTMPVMIVARNDSAALPAWTGGQISRCKSVEGTPASDWELRVAEDAPIAEELANTALPFRGSVGCRLQLADQFAGRIIAKAAQGSDVSPALVEFAFHGHHLFVASGLAGENEAGDERGVFTEIAPIMMFLRHAAGDRAWHMPGSYANLTIDDPWLACRYGNLNYRGLLNESIKHNFHVTVAFIPWNFDRSDHEVAKLFRENPDRLSISIHGNNHDHQEFGDYAHHPLAHQSASVNQAAARMEEFRRRTGVAFDRVMIFPHSIAPERTVHTLKAANYWATINSENVPLHSMAPRDQLFPLRTATLAFDNLLCVKRYSIEAPISRTRLAVNMFLGNPILLYGHQQFFASGIGAFNDLADSVNRIAPATEWRSLGYIVRHLYLMRNLGDRVTEVWAFSPAFVLTNPADHSVVFHVRRAENGSIPIRFVRVDGKDVHYEVTGGELRFEAPVGAGRSSEVEIVYGRGWNTTDVSIAKTGAVVTVLRRLSDLRDMTLSTSVAGRWVIAVYSRPLAVVVTGFLAAIGLVLIGWKLLGRRVRTPGYSPNQLEVEEHV